jgi:hypothetical protein
MEVSATMDPLTCEWTLRVSSTRDIALPIKPGNADFELFEVWGFSMQISKHMLIRLFQVTTSGRGTSSVAPEHTGTC